MVRSSSVIVGTSSGGCCLSIVLLFRCEMKWSLSFANWVLDLRGPAVFQLNYYPKLISAFSHCSLNKFCLSSDCYPQLTLPSFVARFSLGNSLPNIRAFIIYSCLQGLWCIATRFRPYARVSVIQNFLSLYPLAWNFP